MDQYKHKIRKNGDTILSEEWNKIGQKIEGINTEFDEEALKVNKSLEIDNTLNTANKITAHSLIADQKLSSERSINSKQLKVKERLEVKKSLVIEKELSIKKEASSFIFQVSEGEASKATQLSIVHSMELKKESNILSLDSGNVGINSIEPSSKLHINGDVAFSDVLEVKGQVDIKGNIVASKGLKLGMVEDEVSNGTLRWTNKRVEVMIKGKWKPFEEDALYPFQAFTFTNCGAIGAKGPSLSLCKTQYYPFLWTDNTSFFNVKNGIQQWTVPKNGLYRIEAFGASGGNGRNRACVGGFGASISGEFFFTKGGVNNIVVGQEGISSGRGGGGGGGTFIFDTHSGRLLLASGGGGGGADNGSTNNNRHGGQGKNGLNATSGYKGGVNGNDGVNGGSCRGLGGKGWSSQYRVQNFDGHSSYTQGGFGGGGESCHGAGGGGGYSGGAGDSCGGGNGGGGGSYNSGSNQINQGGINKGHGRVTITYLHNDEQQ